MPGIHKKKKKIVTLLCSVVSVVWMAVAGTAQEQATGEVISYIDRLKTLCHGCTAEQTDDLLALDKARALYEGFSQIHEASIMAGAGPENISAPNPGEKEREQREAFLKKIESLNTGQLPGTTREALARADVKLNAEYRIVIDKIRALGKVGDYNVVPDDERDVELDWIHYRDAWTALLQARYPNLDANQWAAFLTMERTAILAQISQQLPIVESSAKGWLATCNKYRGTPLPADIQMAQSNRPPCFSVLPYYGLGMKSNYAEARRCAIQERSGKMAGSANPPDKMMQDFAEQLNDIRGSAMLAMIYADGDGVPRSTPLALRFACEAIDSGQIDVPNEDSPDNPERDREIFPTLLHDIEQTAEKPNAKFDICDYVAQQGRLLDTCGYIPEVRDGLRHQADLKSLPEGFSLQQKAAYENVVGAMEAYLEAHDLDESNVMPHLRDSGGWRGLRPQREGDFIRNVQAFEHGKLPQHTGPELVAVNRELTEARHHALQVLRSDDGANDATLTEVQQLWEVYRDAWIDFGRLRYPLVSKESWLVWLNGQRIEDLKEAESED